MGFSIGAEGQTSGEVVFNTAMSAYQEILTDPGYSNQLLAFTYPHIGNAGVNFEDVESDRIQAAGLIVKDVSLVVSSFRAKKSLQDYLKAENIVGITGVDTRRLTRILREKGSMGGAIVVGTDKNAALELARSARPLLGTDLVSGVSTREPYEWTQTIWRWNTGYGERSDARYRVVALDFGVRRNLLRELADRGCQITVLPATSTAADVLALNPDGVLLTNGPGDPEPCTYAINAVRELVDTGVPVFGVCLGYKILALASGAKTARMKFGQHGVNHPVRDLDNSRVLITAQNHSFAVDPDSLPSSCRVTHVALFDGTLQGFERTDRPAFGFQGVPEVAPGSGSVIDLYDRFISMMEETKQK